MARVVVKGSPNLAHVHAMKGKRLRSHLRAEHHRDAYPSEPVNRRAHRAAHGIYER